MCGQNRYKLLLVLCCLSLGFKACNAMTINKINIIYGKLGKEVGFHDTRPGTPKSVPGICDFKTLGELINHFCSDVTTKSSRRFFAQASSLWPKASGRSLPYEIVVILEASMPYVIR